MARYIDADKLKTIIKNEYANAGSQGEHYAYDDCLSHIDGQPAADVVEVVICKDCKHYSGSRLCYYFADTVFDDDFCSYGERRDT